MNARSAASHSNRDFAKGLARAFAGALIFALPMLMTMEMWWLGFYVDRGRLLLLLLAAFVLLVPLCRIVGFRSTDGGILEDVVDAFTALGTGIVASALILFLLGVIASGMPASEILGKIAIEAVPASIGAALARGQLGARADEGDGEDALDVEDSYATELFLMVVGALFIAFNLAPTEEMMSIAFMMTPWHALALVVFSLLVLHAFVYALDFKGEHELPEGMNSLTGILVFTMAGYGIALLVSLYVLWTFGWTNGMALGPIAMMTAVLGFPAALGAGSARLVV
ncbi:TIGR02587 family membrane protein [Altererythrobacter aerius]|uniref:TIGR02587 family membrane protein n=1 Tax=Tsuneonella aeria TaxID=1837929 RepID=A0A6I4T9E3_9SPHN|nr:TIGR02587 family membrane protein [Tsuneonella aeria]MXO73941.1 TIGR02587 family membrane protein [Tsuneonella aeria]